MAKEHLRPAWQLGQAGNPSRRPLGAPSRLTEKFILALHDDFNEHGPSVIERVRKDAPGVYLKIVASLLPREFNVRSEPLFDGMNDDQLRELIESVRRTIAARTPTGSPDG